MDGSAFGDLPFSDWQISPAGEGSRISLVISSLEWVPLLMCWYHHSSLRALGSSLLAVRCNAASSPA